MVDVNDINQFLTSYHAGAGTHPHDGAPQSVADYGYHETQSQSMTDYDSDETRSMTVRSSNAPSVFTHKSHRTFISSAPSRRSYQQQQAEFLNPPMPRASATPNQFLWCEFSGLLDCGATFRLDDERGWVDHHLDHLQNNCPREFMCWFCDDLRFPVDHPNNAYAVFWQRMQHIRQHISDDPSLTAGFTRPDFNVVCHIGQNGLLPEPMYQHAMRFNELPTEFQLPDSSSSSRPTNRRTREEGQYVVVTGSERRRRKDPNRERRRERHGKTYA